MSILRTRLRHLRTLGRDSSGVAMLEFALALPLVLTMGLTGAEITNFIITRMRVSQIALHLADNAARIGTGSQLQAKTITEADINDLLTGAGLQSGELDLYANGRVVISSIEPSTVNTANSRIRWQRCRGSKTYAPGYGTVATATNVTGIGPTSRQVAAPTDGVTMFVEVYYEYKPLIRTALSPDSRMIEIASMMVRDRRDTSDDSSAGSASTHPNGIYKVAGVTASTC